MQRIDHPTKSEDLFGLNKHGFTEGQPSPPVPATVVTADWANDVQETLCRTIEDSGIALGPNYAQLSEAIERLTSVVALRNYSVSQASSESSGFRTIASGWMSIFGMKYVTVIAGNNGAVQVSLDECQTWINYNLDPSSSANFHASAHAQAIATFCLVGTEGEIRRWDESGTPWEKITGPGSYSGTYYDIIHANGLFVAVGEEGAIHTSSNGSTWTARESPRPTATNTSIAFGNNRFVVRGYEDGVPFSLVSNNATTWTHHEETVGGYPQSPDGGNLVFADGIFICGNGVGDDDMSFSSDGITWHPIPVPTSIFQPGSIEDIRYLATDGLHVLFRGTDAGSSLLFFAKAKEIRTNGEGIVWREIRTVHVGHDNRRLHYANGVWMSLTGSRGIVRSLRAA